MTPTFAYAALFQLPDLGGTIPVLIGVAVVALILFSLVMLFVSRFRRCPSNQVLVIYGKVAKSLEGEIQAAQVYSGGGAFVWPVIQEYAYLDLTPHQINIDLTDALSLENIRVRVPSVVTVAIGDTREYQMNAATRLLTLTEREIQELAANIIFGQMRQVIASMPIEQINQDREGFRKHIEEALEPELIKIGLKLINVNIRDINDDSGYIEAIGRKAGAAAVQQADADVAEENRKGQTAVAEAEKEKEIAIAQAARDREIGVADANREKAIRIADLERERQVAEQRAEYERDTEVAQADQERRIAVAAANAEAIEGESKSKAREAQATAQLHVEEAEAYELGETRRKRAEAAVLEADNEAQAKAEEARARRVEAAKRAELEAPAKAEKARRLVQAAAAAESRRVEAEGDAAAEFAMFEARARGEYEQLSKKAEGLRAIVQACGGSEQAYQLLMLEHIDHIAGTAAEAISNIKFDKVTMWGGAGGNGAGAGVSSFVTDLMGVVPPALQTMLDIGGIKLGDGLIEVVPDEDGEDGEPTARVRVRKRPAAETGDGATARDAQDGRSDDAEDAEGPAAPAGGASASPDGGGSGVP